MATIDGLFSSSLISSAVTDSLPEGFKIRSLERGDYAKGFLECLRVLTFIGDVSEERFQERYDWMDTQAKGGYYIIVIEAAGVIVGTGALIVERKLCVINPVSCPLFRISLTCICSIHNLGTIGHIEEIAVRQDQQGKKLGLKLLNALDSVAINIGCYKTILNCSEDKEGFYVKCGYTKQSLEMAKYFEEEKGGYERG